MHFTIFGCVSFFTLVLDKPVSRRFSLSQIFPDLRSADWLRSKRPNRGQTATVNASTVITVSLLFYRVQIKWATEWLFAGVGCVSPASFGWKDLWSDHSNKVDSLHPWAWITETAAFFLGVLVSLNICRYCQRFDAENANWLINFETKNTLATRDCLEWISIL